MPSPTAISSARSTAWVSRRPGTSASSTARATSAIRADASSPKAAATRTSWLSRISTSISSRRSGTPGMCIGTVAIKHTAVLPGCNFFQSGGQENVSLLIKNGRFITACDDCVADVYCEDGTIAAIGKDLPSHRYQAERTIDAAGQYVLPGGIDVHTHLDMPFGGTTSTDDFETGTIAAAFGGTTCLVDFAIQYRGQTMRHALDEWMKKAAGKAVADYSFHMIVTALPDAGLVDIVHLSSADALQKVREASDMGLPAYAETCPQYLFLSYDNYEEPGFDGAKYVMSPPLREKWHQDVLWKGLAKNDLQVISTDHCPFCMKEQKELGQDDFSKIPNGAPGVETRLTLVHNGGGRQNRISLNRFVELCSTTPAKMFGLFPRKGTIAVGSDADIVVFDPKKKQTLSAKTLHMRVDYNPYEGTVVEGAPSVVISQGNVIIEGEKFVGKKDAGRFIKRGPSQTPAGLSAAPARLAACATPWFGRG